MKKLLALLLAGLMCTSVLVGCGNDDKKPSQTTGSNTGVNEEVDEDIAKVDSYLADLAAQHDLNGATFSYVNGCSQNAEDEEETGNIENDALYKRQRELEEVLGIDWDSVTPDVEEGSQVAGTVEYVRTAVMAGTKAYDLLGGTLVVTIQPLFNEDCLENVNEFSVLDLSADWWPSTLSDTHSIMGQLYFLTGPVMTTYYTDASALLVNKNVVDNYNIEIPYDSVRDGSWTFDKMFEIASAVPANTSGAGQYRYGNPEGMAILFANGMTMTKFDEDGVPYVDNPLPAALSDLASRFSAVMGDGTQTVALYSGEAADEKYGTESLEQMFVDGNILFYFDATSRAVALRENDVAFGILPIPKGSASQSQYYSYASNWSAYFCAVPRCTRDLEVTDVVLEALAAVSYKYIKPAYYDKLLKGRSTHDPESRDMLDIIFETKIYDIIDIYAKGDINQSGEFIRAIEKAIEQDASSLASSYAGNVAVSNMTIKKIVKMLEKHQG